MISPNGPDASADAGGAHHHGRGISNNASGAWLPMNAWFGAYATARGYVRKCACSVAPSADSDPLRTSSRDGFEPWRTSPGVCTSTHATPLTTTVIRPLPEVEGARCG